MRTQTAPVSKRIGLLRRRSSISDGHGWQQLPVPAVMAAAVAALYGPWLTGLVWLSTPGAARAAVALVATVLLVVSTLRQRKPWRLRGRDATGPSPAIANPARALIPTMVATGVLMVAASCGFVAVWALALPAAVATCLAWHQGWRAVLHQPLRLGLAAMAFPWETLMPTRLDGILQLATARAAAWGVTITGLPVQLRTAARPALLGPHELVVSVTTLCAGSGTLLALITLGLLLAEVAFAQTEARLLFVLATPAFGLAGNVLRVVLSTHAANRWAQHSFTWAVAHDGIGYVTFVLTYLALFACVRALRQCWPRASAAANTSSTCGHRVASP